MEKLTKLYEKGRPDENDVMYTGGHLDQEDLIKEMAENILKSLQKQRLGYHCM